VRESEWVYTVSERDDKRRGRTNVRETERVRPIVLDRRRERDVTALERDDDDDGTLPVVYTTAAAAAARDANIPKQ